MYMLVLVDTIDVYMFKLYYIQSQKKAMTAQPLPPSIPCISLSMWSTPALMSFFHLPSIEHVPIPPIDAHTAVVYTVATVYGAGRLAAGHFPLPASDEGECAFAFAGFAGEPGFDGGWWEWCGTLATGVG